MKRRGEDWVFVVDCRQSTDGTRDRKATAMTVIVVCFGEAKHVKVGVDLHDTVRPP